MAADESPAAFYDGLAERYHMIFEDWWGAGERHAEVAAAVLEACGVRSPAALLDISCGIGTQALPLAARGFAVTGRDVSRNAVARARREATVRGLRVDLAVADMRSVDHTVRAGSFAAVLSCDNSLAHLETQAALVEALRASIACVRPGGIFLASVRDYDALAAERPTGVVPRLYDDAFGRRIVGQAWEWAPDGASLRVNLFVLEFDDGWNCAVHTTWSRVVLRRHVAAALAEAGFVDVRWWEPAESGYYQPIVTARRSDGATGVIP